MNGSSWKILLNSTRLLKHVGLEWRSRDLILGNFESDFVGVAPIHFHP